MDSLYRKPARCAAAFTLIETLTVLMLTTLLVTAVLGMYYHVRRGVGRLAGQLEENRLAREILQKVAEDIDRLAAPGFDATMQFRNKYDNGYNAAQLVLENKYYGSAVPPKAEVYDRIVWQTQYDAFSRTLMLYRMHEGLNLEDKVIEKNAAESPSLGLYIPVADGLTHFELAIVDGETVTAQWDSQTLPTSVRVGVSFAPMEPLSDGRLGVPPELVMYRTVAIDRTRFIPYEFVPRKLDTAGVETADDEKKDEDETKEGESPETTESSSPEMPDETPVETPNENSKR